MPISDSRAEADGAWRQVGEAEVGKTLLVGADFGRGHAHDAPLSGRQRYRVLLIGSSRCSRYDRGNITERRRQLSNSHPDLVTSAEID